MFTPCTRTLDTNRASPYCLAARTARAHVVLIPTIAGPLLADRGDAPAPVSRQLRLERRLGHLFWIDPAAQLIGVQW
jgi:hypothetical protein